MQQAWHQQREEWSIQEEREPDSILEVGLKYFAGDVAGAVDAGASRVHLGQIVDAEQVARLRRELEVLARVQQVARHAQAHCANVPNQ